MYCIKSSCLNSTHTHTHTHAPGPIDMFKALLPSESHVVDLFTLYSDPSYH